MNVVLKFPTPRVNLTLDSLPDAFTPFVDRKQWICWNYEPRPEGGKLAKVPKRPCDGVNASTTAPHEWATLEEAIAARDKFKFSGVGFVLSPDDNLTGIDIDNCRDPITGAIEPWAMAVIGETYAEISPSGTGLRMFALGKPARATKRNGVEIYGDKRYLTVTGHRLSDAPNEIRAAPKALTALYARAGEAAPAGEGAVDKGAKRHLSYSKENEARLRSAFAALAGGVDERDAWLRYGGALHLLDAAGDGWEAVARGIWDSWAEQSGKFDLEANDALWSGFKTEGKLTGVASIFHEARAKGWAGLDGWTGAGAWEDPPAIEDAFEADKSLDEYGHQIELEAAKANSGGANAELDVFEACKRAVADAAEAYADDPCDEKLAALEAALKDRDGARARGKRKMRAEGFNEAADASRNEKPNPLIKGLLDADTVSVTYGDSNAGKTFVQLDLAYHVATGTPWNGMRVKQGLVVYVAAEGGARIRRRLDALRERRKPEAEPKFKLVRHPIDLRSSDADMKELCALVRDVEAREGEKCVWLIVDTLSRALAGGDENSPTDMGRIVQAATAIQNATGAHFTYVHHTGKDAARGARGHSLLRAAVDTEIEVTPGGMSATKQRDMDCDFSIGFELRDVALGVDEDGNPIKSAVVEWKPSAPAKAKGNSARLPPPSQRLLMTVITEALAAEGEPFDAGGNTGVVHAVKREAVRERYYQSFVADEGEDVKKLVERRKKTFKRVIESLINAERLKACESEGVGLLWLP